MDKINSLKFGQKILLAVLASEVIGIILSLITVSVLPIILLVVGIVIWILIWVSYSKISGYGLKVKDKFLILGIIIPLFAIILVIITIIYSNMITKEIMQYVDITQIDILTINDFYEQYIPNYGFFIQVLNGMSIITRIIVMGIAGVALTNINDEISQAQQEYNEAYND
jgi:hypothetical protein